MKKKDLLFYVLLVLFIVTIFITLMGITKIIDIEEFYLKGLFAVFIIELGAAVFNMVKNGNLLAESDEPKLQNNNIIQTMNSNDWFELIIEKLSDCGYARLYLRSFDHPDEFKGEHKEKLNKIIKIILEKVKSGADLKIISFVPSSQHKTGLDWLSSILGSSVDLNEYIKVVTAQPVSNSSSMYLFDDKSVIYNKKTNGKTTYHIDNYSNSIIHELIARGFKEMEEE